MVKVTRLNGKQMVLNDDLIEVIEAMPDTTITMTNSHKYIVKESVEEVIEQIKAYNRDIFLDKKNS